MKKLQWSIISIIIIALCVVGIKVLFSFMFSGEGIELDSIDSASEKSEGEGGGIAESQPVDSIVPKGNPDWLTYHGDTMLSGSVDIELPEQPVLVWRFNAGDALHYAPVATDGRIFCCTSKGKVVSLDFQGEPIWSRQLVKGVDDEGSPINENVNSPIACYESTVLVGASRGMLYALDTETGEEKWTYDIDGPILGTANIHPSMNIGGIEKDLVYALSQADGVLHCVDFNTGERLWVTEGVNRCDGSAAVGEGVVVFGSCAAALHVYSASDGKHLKDIAIDGDSQVAGGVALIDGAIFSGSHSGKLLHGNLETGKIVWANADSEYEVFTTPAVSSDWVISGSSDGKIYGLDRKTGEQKWAFETEGFPTSPVIAADKIIVGADGILYLLRIDDGKKLWSYEVSDEISSPAIIGRMIVVGSSDGTINAFGEKSNI